MTLLLLLLLLLLLFLFLLLLLKSPHVIQRGSKNLGVTLQR